MAQVCSCPPSDPGWAKGAAAIEIIDNGPGFPSAFNPQPDGGLGFRVVRALAVQLGATAPFSSSAEGVRFTLTLPLAGIG